MLQFIYMCVCTGSCVVTVDGGAAGSYVTSAAGSSVVTIEGGAAGSYVVTVEGGAAGSYVVTVRGGAAGYAQVYIWVLFSRSIIGHVFNKFSSSLQGHFSFVSSILQLI